MENTGSNSKLITMNDDLQLRRALKTTAFRGKIRRSSSENDEKKSGTNFKEPLSLRNDPWPCSAQRTTKNVDVDFALRSSARTVKNVIARVAEICEGGKDQIAPPVHELSILAGWSEDSYYVVVLAKNRALPIIIQVMQIFLDHAEVQSLCFFVLTRLIRQNEANQMTILNEGGLPTIVESLRRHSNCHSLQVEACEWLQAMSFFLSTQALRTEPLVVTQLVEVLESTKGLLVNASMQETVTNLISLLRQCQAKAARTIGMFE